MARLPLLALPLLLAALASTGRAQTCGPLTFVFGSTGTGCAPPPGVPPVLTAALVPNPSLVICPILFTMSVPGGPISVLTAGFLVVGASNPVLDLTPLGFPGCVLLASPDVLLPMTLAPGPVFTATIPVPPLPIFAGGTGYAQGGLINAGLGGALAIKLSNGVSVSIF